MAPFCSDDDAMVTYMDDFETMGFRMDGMDEAMEDHDRNDIETATGVHILDVIETMELPIMDGGVHELDTTDTITDRATTSLPLQLRSYWPSQSKVLAYYLLLLFVLTCIRNFGSEPNRLGSLLEANPEIDASAILVDQQQSGIITPLVLDDDAVVVSASQRSFALVVQDLDFFNAYNLYDTNQTTATPTLLYKVRTSIGALNFNPVRENSNVASPVLTLKTKPTWQDTTPITYTILVDNQERGITIKRLRSFGKVMFDIALDQNDNSGDQQFGYQIEGSINGVLWMRNKDDEIVAKFSFHTTNFFPGYLQMHVAPGMDQSLVWMCAVALSADQSELPF